MVIKKEATDHAGTILDEFLKAGFSIGRMRSFFWQRADAEKFYASHKGEESFEYVVRDYEE